MLPRGIRALGIDNQSTHSIHEQRATHVEHRIEEPIRIPVRHTQQLALEREVVEAQGLPNVRRNDHGTMRNVDHQGDGMGMLTRDDLKVHELARNGMARRLPIAAGR